MPLPSVAALPSGSAYDLFGLSLHPMTPDALFDRIECAIERDEHLIIGHHNLHSLYLYQRDATMRHFYDLAGCVYLDGMSMVLLGRLLGLPFARQHRMTAVDFIWPLLEMAEQRGWPVFFLGASREVVHKADQVIQRMFPALSFRAMPGFFDATVGGAENTAVLAAINSFRPRLLLVGMGMPRQENWVYTCRDLIDARVILCLGAVMDYMVGAQPTPPRWTGRFGLEWAYRLASEPGRLWSRYLVEPWFVLGWIVRSLLSRRWANVIVPLYHHIQRWFVQDPEPAEQPRNGKS